MQVAKGGEDAYFVSNLHRGVMAVSDGVSGWAEEGIDPADYSRSLAPPPSVNKFCLHSE